MNEINAEQFLSKPVKQLKPEELIALIEFVSDELQRRNVADGKTQGQTVSEGLNQFLSIINAGLEAEAKKKR